MSTRILRYEVPVDDEWHVVPGNEVLHVGCRAPAGAPVEVWMLDGNWMWAVRVFGTGQPLPPFYGSHVGSVIAAGGALVWHVFAVRQDLAVGHLTGISWPRR